MATEDPESPKPYDVDDSQANVEGLAMQTLDAVEDVKEQESTDPLVVDIDADITTSPRLSLKPEVIDLDGYETDVEILNRAPSASNNPLIKSESQANSSLSPEPYIKVEPQGLDVWIDMGTKTIDLVDSDEEIEEPREPNPPTGQPLLRPSVAKSNLTPLTQAALKKTQQKLIDIMRRQHAAGASSIFGGGFPVVPPHEPTVSGPSRLADMNALEIEDDDSDLEAGNNFVIVKEAYERKKQLRINGFEDDVMFAKARVAERARLMRVEEAKARHVAQSSSDEATESDEGLFLPETRSSSSRKRPCSDIVNDEEDDEMTIGRGKKAAHRRTSKGVEEDMGILGSESDVDSRLTAKKPNKRQLTKSREKDLHGSLAAGLDKFLATEARKQELKEKKSRGKGSRPKKTSLQSNANRKDTGKSRRPTQPGHLLNSDSLTSYNVYDEANRNLDLPTAPQVWDPRKNEALAAMLVNVPLENLRKARSEKQHLLMSTKVLGKNGRCYHAGDSKWGLKGMNTPLYSHQIQGAAWMKVREQGESEPRGGLLADHMGIGKTLEILACMVANPPTPADDSKATLIVCTSSLVFQWEQEIIKHAGLATFPIVLRQQAGQRTGGPSGYEVLQNADIIITTYGEVRRSYPKFLPPKAIVLPEKKRQWYEENFREGRGMLHKVRWYRIVLDEAHAIKNRDSQTSVACRGLIAKHRWAVSATPIQNRVEELYAYFKLLRMPHTGTYDTFRENFCDPENPDCSSRLHAILRQIMMRRTHSDTIMGRPLVVLPRNRQKTIELDFNPVERALYDTVERRFAQAINQCGRDGNLERRYRNVLHMLLRLRQMTAHPFMLQDTVEKLFEIEDIEKLTQLETDTIDPVSRDMLPVMRKMIRARKYPGDATPDIISDGTPSEEDDIQEESLSSQLIFTFRKYLQDLVKGQKWKDLKARSLCHSCRDVPEDPWVTDCYHLYCAECLRSLVQEAAIQGKERAACYECSHYFESSAPCTGIAELQLAPSASPLIDSIAPRRNTDKEDLKWISYNGEVLPSTKTAAVQAQIEEWQRENPNKKIIIFSQFHTLMKVLAKLFDQQGWSFVRYNGQMTQGERQKSIERLRDDPDCKIMIASLKAGGVGLNLTMASRVICVDLWWNSCVEQQAFCRVFRIGQNSETFITRFVVKNTVDEKLMQMQKAKAEKIGHAIDDEKMLGALTIRELMGLFGEVRLDANDKPFILVDDEGEFDKEEPLTML
ncbi:MAG: hypothetical protein Q9220_005359 [cf. Caloplaca sp. 1 TL-2023]